MACNCNEPVHLTRNRDAIRRQSDGSIKITINGVSYKVPEFGEQDSTEFNLCDSNIETTECLISSEDGNALSLGVDGLLYAATGGDHPYNTPIDLSNAICGDEEAREILNNCIETDFPEGLKDQILAYDQNNEVVAKYMDVFNYAGQASTLLDQFDLASLIVWTSFKLSETEYVNYPSVANNFPQYDITGFQIPQRISVGPSPNNYQVLMTDTAPDNVASGVYNDKQVVNKEYLNSRLPNFHAEEVGVGTFENDLTVAGSTTGNTASITIDNTGGLLPMSGIMRFTSFSTQIVRIGNGSISVLEQISFDGGTTWIDLSPNKYERTGADLAFTTREVLLLTRAAQFTVPAGQTLTVSSRAIVQVDVPYEAGSTLTVGHELEVIAGTETQ